MRWLVWLGVGVVVLFAIWQWQADGPLEVDVLSPETGAVQRIVANTRAGTVKACQRSALALPIGGQVAGVFVEEGEQVEQGQLLLALSNDQLKARVAAAEAQLVMRETETDLACRQAKLDRREAERSAALVKRKLVSEENNDSAQTKAAISNLRCETRKSEIEVAKANIALAQADLAHSELVAPFSGIVAEINAKVGEFSTPSPPGIATLPAVDLIDMTCLYVAAPIDEIDAAEIRVGMEALISLDALGTQKFSAKVSRIAPYVEDRQTAARTVEVEAQFSPLPATPLLIGYSADIEVILEQKSEAKRIPTELILDGDKLWLLLNDGTLTMQEVEIGLRNWRYAELRTDLPQGARLVKDLDIVGLEQGANAVVANPGAAND